MSESKHDERLDELMSEFLEASDENKLVDPSESSSNSRLEEDYEKLLLTIEDHQTELNDLKSQIDKLQESILSVIDDGSDEKIDKIGTQEIEILQAAVSTHSAQINELLDKQELIQLDTVQEKSVSIEDFNKLIAQVTHLKEALEKNKKEDNNVAQLRIDELTALRASVSDHSSQLVELFNKQEDFKSDVSQDEFNKLTDQVVHLKEALEKRLKEDHTVKTVSAQELDAFRTIVSNQATQINELFDKYNIAQDEDTLQEDFDKLTEQFESLKLDFDKRVHEQDAGIPLQKLEQLQAAITQQSEQLDALLQKQETVEREFNIVQKSGVSLADFNGLKNQLEKLREDVKGKFKTAFESRSLQIGVAPEVVAVQKTLSSQKTKIGDLEYKHNMLKAELDQNKKRHNRGAFGSLGWLLLISNVLLWSVLAYFFWQSNENRKIELIGGNSSKQIIPAAVDKTRNINQGTEDFTKSEKTEAATALQETSDADLGEVGKVSDEPSVVSDTEGIKRVSSVSIAKHSSRSRKKRQVKPRYANRKSSSKTSRPKTKPTNRNNSTKQKEAVRKKTASAEPDVSFGD